MGCTHLSQIRHVQPQARGCEECLRSGGTWVELRLCLTCGHVGCCNDSPGRHAEAHFRETGHPIIRSFQSSEDWAWCYPDESYLDPEWIGQVLEANHRHQCRVLADRANGVRPEPMQGSLLF